jgi:hypothetical protein
LKTSRFVRAALLVALYFGLGALSSAATLAPGKDAQHKASWPEFNGFDVKVTSPDAAGHSTWRGQFDHDSGDIQLDGDTIEGTTTKAGKIILIGGRVLAIQGGLATPGHELDALDSGVLQYQLLLQLLLAGAPDGPAGVNGVRQIDFSQQYTGIRLATSSAKAYIAPPWRVKGTVKTTGPDTVAFDLQITTGVKGKPSDQGGLQRLNYSGHLSKVAAARLDDATSLDGWSLFWVEPYSGAAGDQAVDDYGARPAPEIHKTVAGIRSDIREKQEAEDKARKPAKMPSL